MAPTTRSKTAQAITSLGTAHQQYHVQFDSTLAQTDEFDEVPDHVFNPVPPIYMIDLSLPPRQRFVKVAKDYKPILLGLTHLFDEILEDANLPKGLVHLVARHLLQKLHSEEQTAELKGISDEVGVPLYLLIAYNVLLDMFMGCTSGGIRVKESGQRGQKMMHFRTLDWDMPELRKAIVQFDFVERSGGDVIARTISYVGFVGVLTGLRKGLSVSLNFRPYHNHNSSPWSNIKFYSHLLQVLLGFRPSIAAHLRDFILPRKNAISSMHQQEEHKPEPASIGSRPIHAFADVVRDFPSVPTTAAYLTFCTSTETLILEKDRVTANVLFSTTFITVTNHDTYYEHLSSNNAHSAHTSQAKMHRLGSVMQDLVEESMDRKQCLVKRWEARCSAMRRRRKGGTRGDEEGVGCEELKDLLALFPVTNEQTHFACIMDPTKGVFQWVKCFEEGEIEGEEDT